MTEGARWLAERVAEADSLPIVLPKTQTTAMVVSRVVAAGALIFSAVVAGLASQADAAPWCYGDAAAAGILVLAGIGLFLATSPTTCELTLTCKGFTYRRFMATRRVGWSQVNGIQAQPANRYGVPVVRISSGYQRLTVAGYFDVQANDLADAMNLLRRQATR